jgi:hypothetical protein
MATITVPKIPVLPYDDRTPIPALRLAFDKGTARQRSAARAYLIMHKQMGPGNKPFTWGTVKEWWTIGRYTICRYEHDRPCVIASEGRELSPRQLNKRDPLRYHTWVGGEDTNHGHSSLDEALAHCIAYEHDGINTRADRYFLKAIGAITNATDPEGGSHGNHA